MTAFDLQNLYNFCKASINFNYFAVQNIYNICKLKPLLFCIAIKDDVLQFH